MGKKKTKADAAPAEAATNETPTEAIDAQPETAVATEEPPPGAEPKKKRKKSVAGVTTLGDLTAAYAVDMEEQQGKSDGTIASYKMELKAAMAELGETTPLTDITPEKVEGFFRCKRVTKLRSGKNKSQLSVDKTRRVLRLALVWAEERGIVAKAPLPEEPAK